MSPSVSITSLCAYRRKLCPFLSISVQHACHSHVATCMHLCMCLHAGEKRTFKNGKTGSVMTGVPIRVEPYGCYSDAVVVEVSGRGYYTGEASFRTEEGDPVANGFLIH